MFSQKHNRRSGTILDTETHARNIWCCTKVKEMHSVTVSVIVDGLVFFTDLCWCVLNHICLYNPQAEEKQYIWKCLHYSLTVALNLKAAIVQLYLLYHFKVSSQSFKVAFEAFLVSLLWCDVKKSCQRSSSTPVFPEPGRDYGERSVCMGIFNARCKWDYMGL